MEFQYILDSLEIEFYLVTGIQLANLLGLFVGLGLFCLLLFLIGYEKQTAPLNPDLSSLGDVGDPDDVKINLSRSLLEMDQKAKAKELLEQVLSNPNLLNEKKVIAEGLLKKV